MVLVKQMWVSGHNPVVSLQYVSETENMTKKVSNSKLSQAVVYSIKMKKKDKKGIYIKSSGFFIKTFS